MRIESSLSGGGVIQQRGGFPAHGAHREVVKAKLEFRFGEGDRAGFGGGCAGQG